MTAYALLHVSGHTIEVASAQELHDIAKAAQVVAANIGTVHPPFMIRIGAVTLELVETVR